MMKESIASIEILLYNFIHKKKIFLPCISFELLFIQVNTLSSQNDDESRPQKSMFQSSRKWQYKNITHSHTIDCSVHYNTTYCCSDCPPFFTLFLFFLFSTVYNNMLIVPMLCILCIVRISSGIMLLCYVYTCSFDDIFLVSDMYTIRIEHANTHR